MLLVPVVSSLFTPNLFVWFCVLKCKNDLFEKNNYLFFLNCSCILYVSHVYFPHMFEKASFTESLYISLELVIKAICFRTRLALDTLLYTIYWSFSVFFLSVPVLIHLRDNISHDTFWSWHIYLLIINCTFNCFW